MRTFSEKEARDVFALAARAQQTAREAGAAAAELTLDELQEIGRASGLEPAFVAQAAQTVALGAPETHRRALGPVPTGVGRSVRLAAPPTDVLWDSLVADARRTFHARGRLVVGSAEREWRNGHLSMALRPEGDGSRLDLQTRRTDAPPLLAAALFVALAGVFNVLLALANGGDVTAGVLALGLSVAGGVALGLRQRAWAAERERQMEALTDRAAKGSARPIGLVADPEPEGTRLDLEGLRTAPSQTVESAASPRRRERP